MATRQQQRYNATRKKADAFNAAHPEGTPVKYWLGEKAVDPRQSTIQGRAWAPLNGEAVVCVVGHPEAIYLSRIEVIAIN